MRYEKPEMRIEAFELITVTGTSGTAGLQEVTGTLTYTQMVADKKSTEVRSTITFN